jgi:hypothetical protein
MNELTEKQTLKKIIFNYLDNLTDNIIVSGWELFDYCHSQTMRMHYPSTILKYCREYADITGGEFECMDVQKSIYKFHKGKIILGGFIPKGKE